MKTIEELKWAARQSLSGKWGSSVVLSLVYFVLTFVLSIAVTLIVSLFMSGSDPSQGSLSIFIHCLILVIVFLPMYWAFIVAFLNVARDGSCKVSDLFLGYNDFSRICGTMLLQTVYTNLWSLLLIIPGIIKYYSYALTPYILNDNPDMRYNAAIDKSMAMMKGHKMDLFRLDLSFIGWFILGLITCYIGFLWILPYWQTARAHFYLDLLAQDEQTTVDAI